MAKITRIEVHPYDAVLYLTRSRKAYLKKRAEYTDRPLCLKDTSGMTSSFNHCNVFVIGVFDGRQSTLTHELTHLAIGLLEDRQVPITHATSEVMCYLLSNLIDRTHHLI